jgi:hypothetical protein
MTGVIAKLLQWFFVDLPDKFSLNKAIVAIAKSQNLSRAGAINAITDVTMLSLTICNTIAMFLLKRPDDITRGYDRFLGFTILCVFIVVTEKLWRNRDKND